eukprot:scaffold1390_cov249-Pinguiococcus_pyrenoidosus.AAC.10
MMRRRSPLLQLLLSLGLSTRPSTAWPAQPLWLDLRCCSVSTTEGAQKRLLELYQGTRQAFLEAGRALPNGTAVQGLLLDAAEHRNCGIATGLPQVYVQRAAGNQAAELVSAEGDSHGVALFISTETARSTSLNAIRDHIRRKDQHLMLLREAADADTCADFLECFVFARAQQLHCFGISGADSTLLAQVESVEDLRCCSEGLRKHANKSAPACGFLLPPEPELWFAALSSRASAAANAST